MELIKIETPNGVVINALLFKSFGHVNLCYAQNRIFTVLYVDNRDMRDPETGECGTEEYHYGEILVEYAVIPELDKEVEAIDDMELGTLASEDVDIEYNSSYEDGYDDFLQSLADKYIEELMAEGYSREDAERKVYSGS